MRTSTTPGASQRLQNAARVLAEMNLRRPVSRTELAEATGMSATSITRIISQLSDLGLVSEISTSAGSGRGRRAINLDIRPEGLFSAGFHAHGKLLHSCLMNFAQQVIIEDESPLPEENASPALFARSINSFIEKLKRIMPGCARGIRALGISIPGSVDAAHGNVVLSEYLNWRDVPLSVELRSLIGLPVYIENDVRACLSREQIKRAQAGQGALAYLYAGSSGIGFASSEQGSIIRGSSNAAGEIQQLRRGFAGALADFMLPENLLERARRVCPHVNGLNDIVSAHAMGAAWARILINEFTGCLMDVLDIVRCFFDPGCIILGGDLIDAFRGCLTDALPPAVTLGSDFESACAAGAAAIALNYALNALIEGQEV